MTKKDIHAEIEKIVEPEANGFMQTLTISERMALSQTISLKRIADALCSDTLPACFQSVNAYGENFAVAIQEGIVRGQNGISQYR